MINLGELAPALFRGILDSGLVKLESVFTKGEILQGQVVQVDASKGAVINLRGVRLNALSEMPLVAGQSILVKVDQVKPQFMVSLLSNDTPVQEKTAALLRLYLPSSMEMGEVYKNLDDMLNKLPKDALANSGIRGVMEEIESAIKDPTGKSRSLPSLLGFSNEADMAKGKPLENLKSALMQIQRNLENLMAKDPTQHREALKNVKDLVQSIELRQLMNVSEKQDLKSWEFPFWNGQDVSTARLYVKRDSGKGKKTTGDDTFRITLMLDMSRIGFVRFDVAAHGQKVEGTVYVEGERAKKEIEEGLPSLVESLENLGWSAHIGVKTASKKYLSEDMEEKKDFPVKGLLNVKV